MHAVPRAIVIGAGPAGLAVAACLARRAVPYVVLEREASVGASWRRHYDRLHLHTSKRTSALPYLPFPRSVPRYPSRDEVIAYLESYASVHGVAPRFGEDVRAARRDGGAWIVETERGRHAAPHLVVATGVNGEPNRPSWPGMDAFRGAILHSSEYRNGASWRGADVLVVGLGNSGGEIAIDLHEHGARPALSVRGPVVVMPRDVLGIPTPTLAITTAWLPPHWAEPLPSAGSRSATSPASASPRRGTGRWSRSRGRDACRSSTSARSRCCGAAPWRCTARSAASRRTASRSTTGAAPGSTP
jgi:cation diffusion facilitator CzcD-associated flavoprotein CzcO